MMETDENGVMRMAEKIRNCLAVQATAVANEFIDQYMAAANGEYVKVYLYVLRHMDQDLTFDAIAEALNHTEADVRRAISYWERQGILQWGRTDAAGMARREAAVSRAETAGRNGGADAVGRTDADRAADALPPKKERTAAQLERLGQDQEFSQFLYVTQQYLGKVLTSRECDTLAYLYEDLHMQADLLEYLVESCAEAGHRNLRYIETVGINWHREGITTPEQAKARKSFYSKEVYGVMKAFGISDRDPVEAERRYVDVWFKEYGFSREIVLEACSRTMSAIHKPSFAYADRILSDWRKAGVRRLEDIRSLDQKRGSQDQKKTSKSAREKGTNRFHNFEQSSYDYDAMVWDMIKEQQ